MRIGSQKIHNYYFLGLPTWMSGSGRFNVMKWKSKAVFDGRLATWDEIT